MTYKRGMFCGIGMIPVLLLMFFPACQVKADYSYSPNLGSGFSFNGWVGNIYDFTFGSDSVGKYGLDSTAFQFPLFLGFLGILSSIIIGIIYMVKSDSTWRTKLVETICSGVALFFMSPVFGSTAIYTFYNSLDYHYDYDNFRLGFGFIVLFIYLLIIFVCNLVALIRARKEQF
ncbi:MAG: hypothetical protein IKB70_01850 [Bacilli bacterium]|nr:hypothetical protein [Bacilli bacterium]